jgi:hypothetical protein
LFGGGDAASSVISTITKGLDEFKYTHQEKAEAHAKGVTEGRELLVRWIESTTGSRLARRLIALIVTCIWAMQYIAAQVLSIAAIWSDEDEEKLKASAQIIMDFAQTSNGAMMLVLGFYFAAPHMGSIVGAAMSKFSGSSEKT